VTISLSTDCDDNTKKKKKKKKLNGSREEK
jgi:hypothetical protein